MLSTDRMTETVRGQAKDLISAGTSRLTGALRDHGKAAIFAGTVLALAGAGSASAATISAAPQPSEGGTAHLAGALPQGATNEALFSGAAGRAPLTKTPPAHARLGSSSSVRTADPNAARTTKLVATAQHRSGHAEAHRAVTWKAATHRQVPPADQLTPVGTTGPQTFMPVSQAQLQNARTIVQQALANRMGLRSAVIAVATAMQESKLLNIDYGTSASLGLFQQQVGMGWGTAQQIMNPVHSSDAFLRALAQYQASNPAWANQPLWQAAQGVQASGDPTAYAQWEAQAAQLVKAIAMHGR